MSKILGTDGTPLKQGRPEPIVPPEVEQWGMLVAWLRTKDYTPEMVRATILDYEEKQEESKED